MSPRLAIRLDRLPCGRVMASCSAKVLWLRGQAQVLRSIRLACQMNHGEFADMLGRELGWTVPATVLLAWEKVRVDVPPEAMDAALKLRTRCQNEGDPAERTDCDS